MIPVSYGYARPSKADRDESNLETQLYQLEKYGVRRELIFVGEGSGMAFKRSGWRDLMGRVQPGDVIVVYNLAIFGRHLEESVAIQHDLTKRERWIVSILENINKADENAGARYRWRMMMANGALYAESTGEQIHAGLERAKAEEKRLSTAPSCSLPVSDRSTDAYCECLLPRPQMRLPEAQLPTRLNINVGKRAFSCPSQIRRQRKVPRDRIQDVSQTPHDLPTGPVIAAPRPRLPGGYAVAHRKQDHKPSAAARIQQRSPNQAHGCVPAIHRSFPRTPPWGDTPR